LGWQVTVVLLDHQRPPWIDMPDVEVRVGSIAEAGLPEGTFDVINVNGALERMHRPLEELQACSRLLRVGGMLRVSTPNLASLGHRHYQRHWAPLDPPRNLMLFTASSLERLLERAGFTASYARNVPLSARHSFRESEALGIRRWRSPNYWLRWAAVEIKALIADVCTLVRPDWGERLVATARPVSAAAAIPVAA
jgi:SAM-dependent methyltransferase